MRFPFFPWLLLAAIPVLYPRPVLAAPGESGCTLAHPDSYTVRGSQILQNNHPAQWRGVNILHVFGYSRLELEIMKEWHSDIVRVVISDMKDNPLMGDPQHLGNSWLYSLQEVVEAHRAAGRVVILCPFGWDGVGDFTFLGKNPSETPWWKEYLAKYQEWANLFKNDPGVWFELWNEPYSWDGTNGYSPDRWLNDAKVMVDNIRAVAPNNIIVVPAGKMGGDETVVTDKGPELLRGRQNLVFDVHAYNAWLPDSEPQIEKRIRAVQNRGCAVLFGEVGVTNAGDELDPSNFLTAVSKLGITTLAWIWKRDPHDGNALLGPNNSPNNAGKYHWGKTYYNFTRAPHLVPVAR